MAVLGFFRSDSAVLASFARMALHDRYTGSALGMGWSLLHPLLQLTIYTAVFGFIFRVQPPGMNTTTEYVLWLLAGLVPYLAFVEGVSAGAGSVVRAQGLVKNILFKTELLPLAAASLSLIPLGVGVLFVAALASVGAHAPGGKILLLPVALLIHVAAVAGVALALSALSVFLRDLLQSLPTLLTLLMFATPVFYSEDMAPAGLRGVLWFNPMNRLVALWRGVLTEAPLPSTIEVVGLAAAALITFVIGLALFRRLKSHFELAL
jgi:lipopolysaccharide transport system permease protein